MYPESSDTPLTSEAVGVRLQTATLDQLGKLQASFSTCQLQDAVCLGLCVQVCELLFPRTSWDCGAEV